MTMILSFATREFVVTVADRRLTTIGGAFAEDTANKIVMFCNQMAFAYTGVAEMEGVRTDQWIADELATLPTRSLAGAMNHLRQRATEVFQPLHAAYGRSYNLTIVGVGYTPQTETTTVRPIYARISNAYDTANNYLSDAAPEFRPEYKTYEGDMFEWFEAGIPLTPDEATAVTDQISASGPSGGPGGVVRAFRDGIRAASDRLNGEWVGKSLLAVMVPRASSANETIFMRGPHGTGMFFSSSPGPIALGNVNPEFVAIPADANDPVAVGPRLVCPGLPSVSEFRIELHPEGGT